MSKRVVITGATGFVGANLARRLLRDGHELHVLVRRGYAPWRIAGIQNDVSIHTVDFDDQESLDHIIARVRPEWIFHLAAYGAYSSQNDVRRIVDTNIVGTINLVTACLKVGFDTFINTGSSSEYGFKDRAPTEQEWLDPNSYYAVTKASATLFCRYTAQKYNLRIPTLRLYSVYGPFEEPTRLMPTLIVHGIQGGLPPLVNPDIARDYVYADDVNDAYVLVAETDKGEPNAVYNVGTGTQTSLREVVALVRQTFQILGEPQWGSMPNRSWDTSTWVANTAKIREVLGWQPRYTFEQGFRAMVDWFRENPVIQKQYVETRAHE